jgi:hypothetical protein
VESKWKNYQITTFPGQSLSKTGLSLEEAMDLSQDRLILEYYNYSFIYLYKGYASYMHISRGYVKHKRLRTTALAHKHRNDFVTKDSNKRQ